MRRFVGALVAVGLSAGLSACGTYDFPTEQTATTAPSSTATPGPLTRPEVVGRHVVVGVPAASLVLSGDGAVEGKDGCNDFGGARWRLSGGRVELSGSNVTTLVGCFDRSVSRDLPGASTLEARVDGGLDALDDSGRRVAILGPAR